MNTNKILSTLPVPPTAVASSSLSVPLETSPAAVLKDGNKTHNLNLESTGLLGDKLTEPCHSTEKVAPDVPIVAKKRSPGRPRKFPLQSTTTSTCSTGVSPQAQTDNSTKTKEKDTTANCPLAHKSPSRKTKNQRSRLLCSDSGELSAAIDREEVRESKSDKKTGINGAPKGKSKMPKLPLAEPDITNSEQKSSEKISTKEVIESEISETCHTEEASNQILMSELSRQCSVVATEKLPQLTDAEGSSNSDCPKNGKEGAQTLSERNPASIVDNGVETTVVYTEKVMKSIEVSTDCLSPKLASLSDKGIQANTEKHIDVRPAKTNVDIGIQVDPLEAMGFALGEGGSMVSDKDRRQTEMGVQVMCMEQGTDPMAPLQIQVEFESSRMSTLSSRRSPRSPLMKSVANSPRSPNKSLQAPRTHSPKIACTASPKVLSPSRASPRSLSPRKPSPRPVCHYRTCSVSPRRSAPEVPLLSADHSRCSKSPRKMKQKVPNSPTDTGAKQPEELLPDVSSSTQPHPDMSLHDGQSGEVVADPGAELYFQRKNTSAVSGRCNFQGQFVDYQNLTSNNPNQMLLVQIPVSQAAGCGGGLANSNPAAGELPQGQQQQWYIEPQPVSEQATAASADADKDPSESKSEDVDICVIEDSDKDIIIIDEEDNEDNNQTEGCQECARQQKHARQDERKLRRSHNKCRSRHHQSTDGDCVLVGESNTNLSSNSFRKHHHSHHYKKGLATSSTRKSGKKRKLWQVDADSVDESADSQEEGVTSQSDIDDVMEHMYSDSGRSSRSNSEYDPLPTLKKKSRRAVEDMGYSKPKRKRKKKRRADASSATEESAYEEVVEPRLVLCVECAKC